MIVQIIVRDGYGKIKTISKVTKSGKETKDLVLDYLLENGIKYTPAYDCSRVCERGENCEGENFIVRIETDFDREDG